MVRVPYTNAIGSTIYSIFYTMPDLAHIASILSWYISNLDRSYLDTVKWLMKYL